MIRSLNFNHLQYFWAVAREGSIVRAAEELLVSQPTISLQIRELENALGHRLFDRVGRRLELTETGRLVYGYADEIFRTGQELLNAIDRRGGAGRALRLSVGGKVVDDREGLRAGIEYQIGGMPMSVYSKADYGDDDFFSILGGLRFYFGGDDKSLIRRHREDDPRNRTFDLITHGERGNGQPDGGGGAPQQ